MFNLLLSLEENNTIREMKGVLTEMEILSLLGSSLAGYGYEI